MRGDRTARYRIRGTPLALTVGAGVPPRVRETIPGFCSAFHVDSR